MLLLLMEDILFEGRTVTFDFRGRHYLVQRKKESYTYIRSFVDDSLGQVRDVLLNSNLSRTLCE